MRGNDLDRRIVALALPALGSLVVEPLYTLSDTAIVGHLGKVPLGGLALASSILNVVLLGCGFLSMATAPRVAFCLGRGDRSGAAHSAVSAAVLAGVIGTALGIGLLFLAHPLALIVGGHGLVAAAATTYLRISALGVPFFLAMQAGNGYSRGLSDTRSPLLILFISNVVNVGLEVLFVYGVGWGIAGSALGTVCAQVVAGLWFLGLSRRRVAAAGADWRPQRNEMIRLLRSGVVLTVRTLALLAALSGSTAVAARLGAARLGGHQIGLQIWFLVALSLDALAIPAQILVGEALGGGDVGRAVATSRRVVLAGLVIGAVLGVITAALSPVLPALFTDSGTIRHNATEAILIGGLTMPLCAVAFGLDGVLLGAGDLAYLRTAMVVALVGFAPAAAATLADHRLGVVGVWIALAGWMTARAGLLSRRWRSGRWLAVAQGEIAAEAAHAAQPTTSTEAGRLR